MLVACLVRGCSSCARAIVGGKIFPSLDRPKSPLSGGADNGWVEGNLRGRVLGHSGGVDQLVPRRGSGSEAQTKDQGCSGGADRLSWSEPRREFRPQRETRATAEAWTGRLRSQCARASPSLCSAVNSVIRQCVAFLFAQLVAAGPLGQGEARSVVPDSCLPSSLSPKQAPPVRRDSRVARGRTSAN